MGVEAGFHHTDFSTRVIDFYNRTNQRKLPTPSPASVEQVNKAESVIGLPLPIGLKRWFLNWGNGFAGVIFSLEQHLENFRHNPDIIRRAREPFPYSWNQLNHEPRWEEMPGHWTIDSIEFDVYPLSAPGLLCIARTIYSEYSIVLDGECKGVVCALNWNYEADEYLAYEYLCPRFGVVPRVIDNGQERIFNLLGRSPVPAPLAMPMILAEACSDGDF